MRSYEEILADVREATDSSDVPSLLRLADELDGLETMQASAVAYASRGLASDSTGDHQSALQHYETSLQLRNELGSRTGVALVLGNIGNVYNHIGDYTAAIEHLYRALQIYEELGDQLGAARNLTNIGNTYQRLSDYSSSLEHYFKARRMFEELDERTGLAIVTGNIGSVYSDIGDYSTALEHHNRALAIYKELGFHRLVAEATGNIGNVYCNCGDFAQGLEYCMQALALHEELGDRSGMARVMCNIGNAYNQTNNFSAALDYANRALILHQEMGEFTNVAHATRIILYAHLRDGNISCARQTLTALDALHIEIPIIAVFREIGRSKLQIVDNDLQAAHNTLTRALQIAVSHELRSLQADTHKELRDLAQTRNDFATYIEHNNEYTRINDEIRGRETSIKMTLLAKERDIAEREKEHAKLLAVLHSTLPKHIADRVSRGEVVNDQYDNAAVLFLDIVGFTTLSSAMNAPEVVALLDSVFSKCDAAVAEHGLVKIKTIGDMYMAVAFENITNVASAALDILGAITEVPVRIGIHSGPVVAGVLGKERLQYDVWGDTVNIASRMESTGEPGRIHISQALATELQGSGVTERGTIEVKGKGMMTTYWLERP